MNASLIAKCTSQTKSCDYWVRWQTGLWLMSDHAERQNKNIIWEVNDFSVWWPQSMHWFAGFLWLCMWRKRIEISCSIETIDQVSIYINILHASIFRICMGPV